jgi:glycerate kinase
MPNKLQTFVAQKQHTEESKQLCRNIAYCRTKNKVNLKATKYPGAGAAGGAAGAIDSGKQATIAIEKALPKTASGKSTRVQKNTQ